MIRSAVAALVIGLGIACATMAAEQQEGPADPNYPSDPAELVRVKWDAVIEVLRNEEFTEQTKAERIDKAVSPAFDFELMGKLSLGRTNWSRLGDSQQKEYIRLFTERLKASYRQKISLYKDQTITFKDAVKMPNKTVQVPTELLTGDSKYVILYKLRKNEKKWMVYDVEIQGVSILLTYRSQFNDILSSSSVEEFLKRLAESPDKKK